MHTLPTLYTTTIRANSKVMFFWVSLLFHAGPEVKGHETMFIIFGKFLITSSIVSTAKFLCRSLSLTYQRALTTSLSTLFWNFCIVWTLFSLAHSELYTIQLIWVLFLFRKWTTMCQLFLNGLLLCVQNIFYPHRHIRLN